MEIAIYGTLPKGGGNVQDEKSIEITENTQTTITPDEGYDGIASVEVTTNVQPTLEQKSITITENTEILIEPTTGYDGILSVNVTTDIPIPESAFYEFYDETADDVMYIYLDGWVDDYCDSLQEFIDDNTNLISVLNHIATASSTDIVSLMSGSLAPYAEMLGDFADELYSINSIVSAGYGQDYPFKFVFDDQKELTLVSTASNGFNITNINNLSDVYTYNITIQGGGE